MAGETTGTPVRAPIELPAGLFVIPFTVPYTATELEASDVKQVGFVPKGVKVLGVLYRPTDLDTNVSPAVVQKVSIGSTDIITGLTGAQTGTGSVHPVIPLELTAESLVTITTTTAAATAATTGTVYLGLLVQK